MNQLINEQREEIAHLERINDGLTSAIEKMELAAKELGYDNSMTCSELDYLIETARAVAMVNSKNLELTSQLVAVKESGGTGKRPCAKFCESVALGKDFYQLREHADRMQVERDTLKQQNAELAAQVSDAFGDGYYDGFVDGAKHQDNVDLNTKSQGGLAQIQDEALRCSEIAESEKSKRLGIASRQELAAQVEVLAAFMDEVVGVMNNSQGVAGWHLNHTIATWDELFPVVPDFESPAECLAQVKADVLLDLAKELRELGPHVGVNYQFIEQRVEHIRQGGVL